MPLRIRERKERGERDREREKKPTMLTKRDRLILNYYHRSVWLLLLLRLLFQQYQCHAFYFIYKILTSSLIIIVTDLIRIYKTKKKKNLINKSNLNTTKENLFLHLMKINEVFFFYYY
jgi:hypothetical protein